MNIRKLILKAKLHQIERDYQYFFLYHCSGLKSAQWRQLKDLLYKTQAKALFQPRSHQKEVLRSLTLDKTSTKKLVPSVSKSEATFKKGSSHQLQIELIGKKHKKLLPKDNSILRSISGPFCIFYLTSRYEKQNHRSQDRKSCREVIKIIDSLTSSSNFLLLSGQMESTQVNHIDIKEALNLEYMSVYQQFLSSIEHPLQNINFCMDHNRLHLVSELDNISREK